jgi:hypothetical protein
MFSGKNNHYEPAEWVDFVRALVDKKTHEKMQANLDSAVRNVAILLGFFLSSFVEAAYPTLSFRFLFSAAVLESGCPILRVFRRMGEITAYA